MQKDFSKQLIKGKIAELIFDQMFREASKYTVIPFGYESVVSELMQYRHANQGLLENIRNAPDFALVSHEPEEVFLVEVKYRAKIQLEDLKKTASAISRQWKLAWLFFATPTGFYFDKCSDLEKDKAKITPLSEKLINRNLQEKYLSLLNEFIKR